MKKVFLAIIVGLSVTACGGGGGSSSNNANSQESINAQLRELKTVDVEGHKIYLTDEPAGFIERNIGNKKVKGFNQFYSYVGYSLPKDVRLGQYGRINDVRVSSTDMDGGGLQTAYKDIPKSGEAIYNGVALGANSEGKFMLVADFTAKYVYGGIYGGSFNEISLDKASISQYKAQDEEAHFAGKASSFTGVPLGYGGTFMGPNAEEVIGLVTDRANKPYVMFAGTRGTINSSVFDNVNMNNEVAKITAQAKAEILAAERKAKWEAESYVYRQ